MKKVVIYFSDIVGTIFGKAENTDEVYQMFNELLASIKKHEDADEIVFSLISSDNQSFVENTQNTISPFIDGTVVYGKQFFGDGYYQNGEIIKTGSFSGKVPQIANYINELSATDEVVAVYYADDTIMYQELLNMLAKKCNWSEKLTSIIPKQNIGLAEVNSLLEESINNKFGNNR